MFPFFTSFGAIKHYTEYSITMDLITNIFLYTISVCIPCKTGLFFCKHSPTGNPNLPRKPDVLGQISSSFKCDQVQTVGKEQGNNE